MNAEVKIDLEKQLVVGAVPASMIEIIWDQVEPLIQRVIDKAPQDLSMDRIKSDLIAGNTLLVVISRKGVIIAANVLQVDTLDTGLKILYIPITAGDDLDLWMEDFLELAKRIAKDHSCVELRGLSVRKGWMVKLKHFGWEEHFVTIRCKLGE